MGASDHGRRSGLSRTYDDAAVGESDDQERLSEPGTVAAYRSGYVVSGGRRRPRDRPEATFVVADGFRSLCSGGTGNRSHLIRTRYSV